MEIQKMASTTCDGVVKHKFIAYMMEECKYKTFKWYTEIASAFECKEQ